MTRRKREFWRILQRKAAPTRKLGVTSIRRVLTYRLGISNWTTAGVRKALRLTWRVLPSPARELKRMEHSLPAHIAGMKDCSGISEKRSRIWPGCQASDGTS